MSPHKPRVGSLFAGIGGFDLAAERAGMEVVWQSEIDRHASAVLKHHWPEVPNYGDIHSIGVEDGRGLSRSDIRGRRSSVPSSQPDERPSDGRVPDTRRSGDDRGGNLPAVDVLTGGFPCQDYSVAGNRGGLAGDRGALWWEYHRLIARLRPTWVVGENVPGLLSSRDGADFETIVGSLTECGYGVAWAVLDAQYFGVAQRRRRVFIVGHSGGVPRPEVLALGEGLYGHPEPRRETGKGVAVRTASGLGGGGPDDNLAQAGHLPHTVGALRERDWKGPPIDVEEPALLTFNWQAGGDTWTTPNNGYTDALHAGQTPAVAFAQNQRDEVRELGDLAGGLQSEPGMKQQTYVVSPLTSKQGPARLDSHAVNGGQLIPTASSVRRLTPLECERLQGFPDGWTDIPGNSDTQRYRQLGNAVAVPVTEWLLRRLADA